MFLTILSIMVLAVSCCVFTTMSGLKWRESANIDSLTGMFNRKILSKIYDLDLKEKYFIFACDIDHFKKVNDTYGHAAGDLVLKSVSELLLHSFKENRDFVVRFGGEEFFVFISSLGMSEKMVIDRSEELRVKIEEMVLLTKDMSVIKITSSFGLSFKTDIPIKDRIEHADNNLYIAKENGRNKVVF